MYTSVTEQLANTKILKILLICAITKLTMGLKLNGIFVQLIMETHLAMELEARSSLRQEQAFKQLKTTKS